MCSFASASFGRLAAIAALVIVCPGGGRTAAQPPAEIPVVRLELDAGQAPGLIPALPVTRLDDRAPAADVDRAPAISLSFSEPLPVRDVLLLLFRGTPFSVVFEPAASGTFAGELSDLTLRQALEAVLVPVGLSYSISGTVVRVFPRRPETRLFDVTRIDVARSWRRRLHSSTTATDGAPSADLASATDADPVRDLSDGIAALISPGGRFHIDRKAGLVQVTDFADRLDQVGLYLEAVGVRAARQVRLQARVIEVVLPQAGALDWAAIAARSGVRSAGGAGIRVDDFDALLRVIASFGDMRIVAAPQVLAMNNEPAVMRIGSHSAAFAAAGNGEAHPGSASNVSSEALTLTIVPQIGADGIVQMSVSPTFTGRAGANHERSIVEADTTMRVHGGETVVLAGFLRDVVEAPPASGLSAVFGGKDRRTTRRELVILLTPTVVGPGNRAVTPQ